MEQSHDVIIIGAGPAGLTAGLYCAQAGFTVVALEKEKLGGQILDVEKIENYPGFAEGISGAELGTAMFTQAMNFGVTLDLSEVEGVDLKSVTKRVRSGSGTVSGRCVILCGGAAPKKLGVPGEDRFSGKGVAYCAMCEGSQFRGKVVAVAGAGNSGLTEALYLAKIAAQVIVVEGLPHPSAVELLQKRARETPNMRIVCNTVVEAIEGDSAITGLSLVDNVTKARTSLPVQGILVHIGVEPRTGYLRGVVELDEQGQIMVNGAMETSLPGVFAAGDIRHGSPRQVAAAVGDGTLAAIAAQKYLRETQGS